MKLIGRRGTEPATPPVPGRALVASGTGRRIDLSAVTEQRVTKEEDWQKRAWKYRDQLGEIRYAMAYLSHAVGRCRIFPAVTMPDDDDPVPLTEADPIPGLNPGIVQQVVDDLTMGTGQWGEIVPEAAHCMEIAGEALLVAYPDMNSPTGRKWEARSVDSLRREGRGWQLIDTPGARSGIPLDAGSEDVFTARMWQPHPRWRGWADSPMRALLDPCEELALISRTVRGTARSRFAGAGLLAVPDGLDFPGSDDFIDALTSAMTASMGDEADARNVVPAVIKGDGDLIAKIQHLLFERPLDAGLITREEAALKRIGTGLDVPPEIITGMAEVNHWTAWQVDSSTIKGHVEPLLVRVLAALEGAAFRALLREYGAPPDAAARVRLWYSVDPLTVRPNRSADADAAWDRHAISWEAYRDAKGFGEEDAPDDDELAARLALAKGSPDVALLRDILTEVMRVGLSEPEPPPAPVIVAQPEQPAVGAAPDSPTTEGDAAMPQPTTGITAAATAAPVLRLHASESARLARIDTDTRGRLAAAIDAAVTRAVERASNRARGAAQKDPKARAVVASAAPNGVCAALGRDTLTAALGVDVAALLAGAWDTLETLWGSTTDSALKSAAAVVAKVTGDTLPDTVLAAAGASTAQAWQWLRDRLDEHATALLFDPEAVTQVADVGEEPGLPGRATTLARGALAHAGGIPATAGGVRPDGTVIADGPPVGGIATGGHVLGHLRASGVDVIGYEWVCGVSRNVFEPHQALDGVIVSGFASPLLAHSGWPGPVLAPGDHYGCHCDLQPVLGDGARMSDALDAIGESSYDPSYLAVLREVAANDEAEHIAPTTVTDVVAEADRVADHRPSRRS